MVTFALVRLDLRTLYKMRMNFCWFVLVKYFSPGEKSDSVLLQQNTNASSINPAHQVRIRLAVETWARSKFWRVPYQTELCRSVETRLACVFTSSHQVCRRNWVSNWSSSWDVEQRPLKRQVLWRKRREHEPAACTKSSSSSSSTSSTDININTEMTLITVSHTERHSEVSPSVWQEEAD